MRPLLGAVLAALVVAGCGGGDDHATTIPVVGGAATTPTTTDPNDEDTIIVTTTGGTRTEPITVKGRLGDALTLMGQSGYKKPSKVAVRITVEKLVGPFKGFNLAPGRKLIGVELHFQNVGAAKFDDPLPGGTLMVAGGESGKQTSLITTGKRSPCDNPSLKLTPGQSRDVCIAYDVPKNGKPLTFEYAADSGYGDTGLWRLA